MRSIRRAGAATMLTGALCAAIAAAPAGAATRPSLASVEHSVHAADGALLKLKRLASSDAGAAKSALLRSLAQITAAAHQAQALQGHAGAATMAKAFGLVASQYDRDVRAYTSLLGGTGGSLQSLLAGSLQPVLAGRTQALAFLGQLTSVVGADTGAVTNTIANVLGNSAGEIKSLTGLIGGNLPKQVQGVIAQALSTATGVLDAGLAQLKALIPTLPAPAQGIAQAVLTQISGVFDQLKGALTGATDVIPNVLGGNLGQAVTGQIGQVLKTIGGILGVGGVTGGTGTGNGTGTGTPGGFPGLGGLIPPFVGDLLNSLGVGSLFPKTAAH
jgi:hypothetical protein